MPNIYGQTFTEIILPAGWILHQRASSQIAVNLTEFKPSAAAPVKIGTFLRGLPLNQAEAAGFLNILKQSPHKLTSKEIESVQSLLNVHQVNPRLDYAGTERINGKVVLTAVKTYKTENDFDETGHFRKGVSKYKSYEIYVDSGADGRWAEVIYYHAKFGYYWFYKRQAKKIFRTITWKN